MKPEELKQKVELYLQRAREYKKLNYNPNKVAYWSIVSGIEAGTRGDRETLDIVLHGKFIDAVAYAVQQDSFYHWDHNDPSNDKNGEVRQIECCELKEGGLVTTTMSHAEKIQRRRQKLSDLDMITRSSPEYRQKIIDAANNDGPTDSP